MEDLNIILNKGKSTNYLDSQSILSTTTTTPTTLSAIKEEKDKYKINQIMNYLYYEFHSIDLFSTFELERIIIYSGLNKQKTLSLLDNYTKEEIMKMIEDSNLTMHLNKSKSENLSTFNNKISLNFNFKDKEKVIRKEIYSIGILTRPKLEHLALADHEKPWSFITSHVNIIDLKDILNTFDHHKLIKKAQATIKDKDNSKLNEYFEKYTERREKKYQNVFKANLEANDLNYLRGDNYMATEVLKKQKKTLMNNITENIQINIENFYANFSNSNNFIKSNIIEFLDIFSIGKFGMCDKYLNNFIYKKFDFEKVAKNYALAIFKNLNLYINDQDKLKYLFKNYFTMIKTRPRIRFCGIYYSKVKFNKVGDDYGFSGGGVNTVIYYRVYRFLPNGEIYSLTTPNIKSNKIWNLIHRNNIDMKNGRYYIDEENTLIMDLNSGIDKSNIYRLKIREFCEYPDLKFNGLELLEFSFRNGNEIIPIKLTDYFPKFFKFRSLDVMKNDVYLFKSYE